MDRSDLDARVASAKAIAEALVGIPIVVTQQVIQNVGDLKVGGDTTVVSSSAAVALIISSEPLVMEGSDCVVSSREDTSIASARTSSAFSACMRQGGQHTDESVVFTPAKWKR